MISASASRHPSEVRILDAALRVIRSKGYTATRIEDVCAEAGLTKGSFFHHFKSKEDLALASAAYWNEVTGALFASAPYQAIEDPVARLVAYVDFRIALIEGDLPDYTCLLGTMVQDTYETHPEIRDACETYIRAHASTLTTTIADAKRRHAPHASWSAEGLGLHLQASIQGAFVLAKASRSAKVATDSLQHLRRYVVALFDSTHQQEIPWTKTRKSRPASGSTATPKRR